MSNDSNEICIEKLYFELGLNIRQTDDISFKLLGLVPVLSGAGVFTLVLTDLDKTIIFLLSIIGIIITFSLWLWEQRNIGACKKYRDAAIKIENNFSDILPRPFSDIKGDKPKLLFITANKRRAENLIYVACLTFWFVPLLKSFCS